MAKVNMKQALIDKGERYAFIAAGGLMVLLMIIGVMEFSNSPNTEAFVKDVESNSQRIKSGINNTNAEAPPLPVHLKKAQTFPSVQMSPLVALNFDPIAPPDLRRTNPVVRQIIEMQADFIWAKIPALDIKDTEDGKRLIGVLVAKSTKNENFDKDKQSQFMNEVTRRLGKQAPKKRPQPMGNMGGEGFMGGGPGPMGFMGGGPVGPMGFMGGGPVGPMGFMGGGPGPGPGGRNQLGGFGGERPGGEFFPGPGGGVPGGGLIEVGERLGVEYVPLEPEKLADKRFALTIYPQRMVVIHAAFPYKEQVLEFARALRLKDPMEIFDQRNDATPIFKGFLIERKILYPDKRVAADWHPLNYANHYKDTIYPRTLGDHEDSLDLNYVRLPVEAEMMMPLPDLSLMRGTYPELRLESINGTIRKFNELNKPPAPPKSKSKQLGQGSVFGNNTVNQEGFYQNQPTSPEGGGLMIPKGKKGAGTMSEGSGTTTTTSINDLPDAVLIRLIDNDIMPNRLYTYRIKVLMQNPNWAGPQEKDVWEKKEKFELVSQRQDAKRQIIGASEEDFRTVEQRYFSDIKDEKARLEEVRWNLDKKEAATPWFELKGTVSVPREEFFFAVDPPLSTPDPKDPKKTTSSVTLKPGEGLLQIQRWMATANIKGYREPVADWVVADVLAKRGYYFGGEQFVNLPIWSSEFNRYILRKAPAEKDAKQKELRRGVVMDPTKPGYQFAVVDVEGGTIGRRISTIGADGRIVSAKDIADESAAEVLLVDEEGNLMVRNTARDRNSLDRYMPDAEKGPYIIHNGNQVSRYQPNQKYSPPALRVLDREEVWNKWVEDTDKASRAVDPESGPGVGIPPKKFD